MKILITGGGGFLGQNIFKKLLNQGHELFSFSRSDHPFYLKNSIHWLKGDLKNFDEVKKALKGKDVVFHTASKVAMWGRWEEFYTTNVIGSENIIRACQEEGISKLIYTSSPSVVFGEDDLKNADESIPYPQKFITSYGKSKALAEQLILKAHGKKGLATVALRPHLIFGEDDPHLIPRLLEKSKKNKLIKVGDGKNLVDVIYVENAAYAHILAMEKLSINSPIGGNPYFLGQEKPVFLWTFIEDLLKIKPIKKKISPAFAYLLGSFFEKFYRLCSIYHKEPPITRFIALQLSKNHYFSHENAIRDLNYRPLVSLDEALKRVRTAFN